MTNEDIKEEHIEEGEAVDFTQPNFSFSPNGRHTYRQEGGYLVCKSCTLHHAIWIGMERLMVGELPDGTPILKLRSELGFAPVPKKE
jgi:hypothetical protein